tara:strand:+ start:49 stop:537 length:489 start_codon:yes stop_codon:yes gene_type:complete
MTTIAIIYKLTDNSNKVYYGHTTNTLKNRLSQHKANNNKTSSKIMDSNSMKIECLEQYVYDINLRYMDYKDFLIKKESYYVKNFECINKKIPGRTMKECSKLWVENNREDYYLKQKIYREKNKKQLAIKASVKYNCDCGGTYKHKHKSQHIKSIKHQKFINI